MRWPPRSVSNGMNVHVLWEKHLLIKQNDIMYKQWVCIYYLASKGEGHPSETNKLITSNENTSWKQPLLPCEAEHVTLYMCEYLFQELFVCPAIERHLLQWLTVATSVAAFTPSCGTTWKVIMNSSPMFSVSVSTKRGCSSPNFFNGRKCDEHLRVWRLVMTVPLVSGPLVAYRATV